MKDLDEEDLELIKIRLERGFPDHYLNSKQLPNLLVSSLGTYLAQSDQTEISVVLPPAKDREITVDKNMQQQIAFASLHSNNTITN